LEHLLWNRFQCLRYFFRCFQHPEIFVPSRQTLVFKTIGSHSELNYGNRVDVSFRLTIFRPQTACSTESALWAGELSQWKNQSVGQSLGLFYAQPHIIASVFPNNKLGWVCWNEFKVNNTFISKKVMCTAFICDFLYCGYVCYFHWKLCR
jgi:hypothetical protein